MKLNKTKCCFKIYVMTEVILLRLLELHLIQRFVPIIHERYLFVELCLRIAISNVHFTFYYMGVFIKNR